jgi:hypothetical protein
VFRYTKYNTTYIQCTPSAVAHMSLIGLEAYPPSKIIRSSTPSPSMSTGFKE